MYGSVYVSESVCDLHGSETQDNGNGDLGLRVHFHIPDQKHRKDAKGPVRGRAHGRMRIGRCGDPVWTDARPSCSGWIPERGDGVALENEEEEEEDSEDDVRAYRDPDDLDVSSMDGDPEEEQPYSDFEDRRAEYVG